MFCAAFSFVGHKLCLKINILPLLINVMVDYIHTINGTEANDVVKGFQIDEGLKT